MAVTPAEIGQFLEGMMYFCFGVSWPVALLKTVRAKRTEGKSVHFVLLVFIGYIGGLLSKFVKASGKAGPLLDNLEWITALVAINTVMVGADLVLTLYYTRRPGGRGQSSSKPLL